MSGFDTLVLIALTAGIPIFAVAQTPVDTVPALENAAYETRIVTGWTVHIRQRLLVQESNATTVALGLLERQLQEIVLRVPPMAVTALRQVPLYFSPEYPGVPPRAEFHPGADWLRQNGRDPVMAKGIEFTNLRIFAREMDRMPNFALHELAHAYHFLVLPQGFNNRETKAIYEKAKAGGQYDRVEHWHGGGKTNTFDRAYALNNPQEFFAENTEAYFSRNDFFPFTRSELKRHDPETFALLTRLWGVPESTSEAGTRVTSEGVSEAVAWLKGEAQRIIRGSQRVMKDGTSAFPPQMGIGYEAFWLRDYEYTLEGSIATYSEQELIDACRLFVRSINADGAGVDCIKFDGTPIYQPGFGSMGENPVADGSQFTVGVAFHTYRKTQDAKLLDEILDPLIKAMNALPRNPATGLVYIDPARPWDRCPYGFTDSIRKQGDELFCSLLDVQACRQLSELLAARHRTAESGAWKEKATRVAASIRQVFWDAEAGLFRAATVKCREHDLWGSAFAVFLGVADFVQSEAIAQYFARNYGQIIQHGQMRHLPAGTYWEQGCNRDQYQNGGYWATPVGWFVYTLDLVDPVLADQSIMDLVHDFKQYGACEWILGERRQLPNYLASAALPLDGIGAMLERREKGQPNQTGAR
jgi:hypothetical protein